MGGGDGVLAHIRDLKDVSDVPPVEEIDRAARWVKRKLAERRQYIDNATIFMYYGGKWRARRTIRSAQREHVIEPFGGICRNYCFWEPKKVTLIECDPLVAASVKCLKASFACRVEAIACGYFAYR